MKSKKWVGVLLIFVLFFSNIAYAEDSTSVFDQILDFFKSIFGGSEAESSPRLAPGDIGPVLIIQNAASSSATLGFPRWKMFMDPIDSSRIWLLVADGHDQLFLSEDGGANWDYATNSNPNPYAEVNYSLEVESWINYHASLYGDKVPEAFGSGYDVNLYVTYPSSSQDQIYFKKISDPASSDSDISSQVLVLSSPGNVLRSNIVANEDYTWVFTRGNDSAENVKFFRYDKNNNLVDSGYVSNTGYDNVRIGSTLDVNGNPIVLIFYMGNQANQPKLKYFNWDDKSSSFVENFDSDIGHMVSMDVM